MTFDPKIQEIKAGPYDKLSISLDHEEDQTKVYPVLLYVPNQRDAEHRHIDLTKEQAIVLRDWLNDYLKI